MHEKYAQTCDEELIDRLREGESSIIDYIMDKYKNLVRNKARSMYILGADTEVIIAGSYCLMKMRKRVIMAPPKGS